jgi:hypothetical protein
MRGVVLDRDSQLPLENVNIFYAADAIGTVSDKQGKFTLALRSTTHHNDKLRFSRVGYKTRLFTRAELAKLNFRVLMAKTTELLDEVSVRSVKALNASLPFKRLSPLKKGLFAFGSTIVNDKIYVIGGDESTLVDMYKKAFDEVSNMPNSSFDDLLKRAKFNMSWENFSEDLQIYDIENDIWLRPDIKFRKRAYHDIVHYNGKIYVFGGKMLSRNKKKEYLHNTIEIYDLEKESIIVDETNPHQAVRSASVFRAGRLIVMGGSVKQNKNGEKVFTNTSHLYDIDTGLWYNFASIPEAKETKGVLAENTIYLVGGDRNTPLKKIEAYDLVTGKWSTIGELPMGIESPGLAYYNHTIYIADSRRIYVFDIAEGSLTQYGIDLDVHGASLLYHNEQLFILGGYRLENFTLKPSSSCYSIDLEEFSNTRIMSIQKF